MDVNENKNPEEIKRWKLLLQIDQSEEQETAYTEEEKDMQEALGLAYYSSGQAGLRSSNPKLNKWLGDIRKYFPKSVAHMMQKDAIDRHGIAPLLLKPEILEHIQPDVNLLATLINLKDSLSDEVRESAKIIIKKVVDELMKKFRPHLTQEVRRGVFKNISSHRKDFQLTDWHRVIRANLKHYQPQFQTIIPEKWYSHLERARGLKHIVLLVDQSASMAESVVYASIFGAILASIPTVSTRMILFDTEVVDVTDQVHDPVEILFSAQLGGGTNIFKALQYADQQISNYKDTLLFLISDVDEGYSPQHMLQQLKSMKNQGLKIQVLLNLSDEGKPYYAKHNAASIAKLDIPAFACTPDRFVEMMSDSFG